MTKNLDAIGSFKTGFSIANAIKQQQQQDEQLQFLRQKEAYQQQQDLRKIQQEEAKKQLRMEAFNNPAVLAQLYAMDPQEGKSILEAKEYYNGKAYQGIESLKKSEDKQKAWTRLRSELSRDGVDVSDISEDYSPEVAGQLEQIQGSLMDPKAMLALKKQMADIELAKAHADYYRREQETGGGATAYNVERIMKDNPGMNYTDALYLYQTGLRRGTERTEGGIVPQSGTLATEKSIEQAKSSGRKTGELQTEREFNAPKAFSAMEAAFAKNDNVIGIIDEILPKVSQTTAGVGGTLISKLPVNSEARDMQKQLTTVIANLGFDELQEMRNNSPTGGALGQVAVQEIKFLQSVKAYLEADQSPEQLTKNLERAKKEIMASKNRVAAAYEREYGSVKDRPQKGDVINWGDL